MTLLNDAAHINLTRVLLDVLHDKNPVVDLGGILNESTSAVRPRVYLTRVISESNPISRKRF